jgi:hypothetical protein
MTKAYSPKSTTRTITTTTRAGYELDAYPGVNDGPGKSAKTGKGCLIVPEARRGVQTQSGGSAPT